MFVQFSEIDGRDGKATVLIAPAVHGPEKLDVNYEREERTNLSCLRSILAPAELTVVD